MVEDASTWQHHRRRRRKKTNYPSQALLASLAAFIPPAVLARPVLLPFLYPSIPQSTSTSAPPRPKPKRSATPTASSSDPSSSRQPSATSISGAAESRRADRIASNYQPDDNGHFKPTCWSLHGQSNCPRDQSTEGINDPDVHEVVPGAQPDFPPTSTSATTPPSTSAPSPTTTSPTSTTSTASPSATTVEPYTMTFEVSNIPPGWQKSGRTSFYSKNIIIGFSVTLAALICLTIVLCVIWRIRVARERRESERALKEKKKELGVGSQTTDDASSYYQNDEDRESTRQRGLRRRRANVRVGDDEDDDEDDDDDDGNDNDGDARLEDATAMSEKNGMTPTGRKRRTAFMRTFSGKMLTAPGKWRRKSKRRQQDQDAEEDVTEVEERDITEGTVREHPERRSTIPAPLESQNSSSLLLLQPPTSSSVVEVPPVPLSPPPPPPASLQPSVATTSPLQDGQEDDEDPTSLQPPAYRRRNFGMRSLGRPATTNPSTSGMSQRALEKQREAEGDNVPEEYMYLAGMMPPPLAHQPLATSGTNVVVERSRAVLPPPPAVEQDQDDEEAEEEDEAEGGQAMREDVTAHLATDDKTVLARLHQGTSAPSAPPLEPSSQAEATVPREEDVYELEGSGSGSSYPLPPPSPTEPTSSTFLPAPPAITSAHLFFPPSHEDGSELPQYVAGPSAPSFITGVEKSSTGPSSASTPPAAGPSEPPAAEGENSGLVVPSAPPMTEDEDVARELVLVPSAPPLDEGDASSRI